MGTTRGCRVKDLLDIANGHVVCEEGDKLTYSKYGRFCHEVKINYSPYVNYFTRVYWNRSYFVYKINTVISFQSWKIAEPSFQRLISLEGKCDFLLTYTVSFRNQSMDIWNAAAFSLLLLTGFRVLQGIEHQTLPSFGKMSNLPVCHILVRCFPYHYMVFIDFIFSTIIKLSS